MQAAGVSRSPRREMIGACTGALLDFLVVSMSGLLVPLMALDFGASPATIGVLLSVTSVGSSWPPCPRAFSSPGWGRGG